MSDENRLKRLRMRSWRRGIKEMDLILGPFADDWLARLDDSALDTFEAILGENDHDLYQWVTARIGRHDAAGGQAALGPSAYDALMTEIARHAAARLER
ncbi:succinate dehydrogenase assembly factor 2 [Pararhodobacter sp.]|uniref:FAD assembly factor SdhE n=1 Tax=Pararhodobacter sp. TaxID=2127056 RepID=UPI002D1FAB53|nr:succinate dehydrogenase assembly factor 2 [Pararhodobacter sp.]